MRLAGFAKECKEKKLRAFSSYKSNKTKKDVSKVFYKYGIDSNESNNLCQVSITLRSRSIICVLTILSIYEGTYSLEDDDEGLKQCISMRCEYISTILHASLYIVKRITKKSLTLKSHFEIVGEESIGNVDYVTKAPEELICIAEEKSHQVSIGFAQDLVQCESALQVNKKKRKASDAFKDDFDYIYGIVTTATEWYFILYISKKISCTSKCPLYIPLVESALKEDSVNEKKLCDGVKQVIEVIVGLLKDRVEVEKEPVIKKQRVKGYFEKQE